MKPETFAQAREQVKTGLSDVVRDFSDSVTNRWKETHDAAQRGAKKVKIATEEGVEGTREKIKSHPILFVTLAASGAFVLGCLAGWIAARDRRS